MSSFLRRRKKWKVPKLVKLNIDGKDVYVLVYWY